MLRTEDPCRAGPTANGIDDGTAMSHRGTESSEGVRASRRDVLRATAAGALGSALADPAGGSPASPAGGARDGTVGGSVGRESSRSPVDPVTREGQPSMRAIAERMDPVRTPDRVRGGTERSDRAPDCENASWLLDENRESASQSAHDLGLYHDEHKGILETHRADSGSVESVRAVLDRHAGTRSSTHRFLFYNTWLLDAVFGGEPLVTERSKEIGRAIGAGDYDVVTLCEVFGGDERDRLLGDLEDELAPGTPTDFRTGPPSKGLEPSSGLLAGVIGDDKRIVRREREVFEEISFPSNFAQKGILYLEVDLGPGNLDLFVTHADSPLDNNNPFGPHDPEEDDLREVHETRKTQLRQICRRIDDWGRPSNVTVVTGDMNINSQSDRLDDAGRTELEYLLDTFRTRAGLQDVALTRGGVANGTFDPRVCTPDAARGPCYCDPYECGDVSQTRYDYLFVERPKPTHTMNLDLTRLRRRQFAREEPGWNLGGASGPSCESIPPGTSTTEYAEEVLSDHLPLEVTMVASPRSLLGNLEVRSEMSESGCPGLKACRDFRVATTYANHDQSRTIPEATDERTVYVGDTRVGSTTTTVPAIPPGERRSVSGSYRADVWSIIGGAFGGRFFDVSFDVRVEGTFTADGSSITYTNAETFTL